MFLLILLSLLKLATSQSSLDVLGSCPNLLTSNLLDSVITSSQPSFINYASVGSRYSGADSICLTVDCLPDNPNVFIVYQVIQYPDASIAVQTFIHSTITPGIYTLSTGSFYQIKYDLGPTNCGTYMKYICEVCETGAGAESFPYGTSTNYGQIPRACLAEVQGKLAAQNITDELEIFPMNLTPQCYYPSCTNCFLSANPCTTNYNY